MTRSAPALAACSVALVSLTAFADPSAGWVRRAGLDVWNATVAHAHLRAEEERRRDLDAEWAAYRERSAAEGEVLDRLIAGALPLAEAAADLERLRAECPGYLLGLRETYPGATDRERVARSVVVRAETRVGPDPGRRAEVRTRLQAELDRLYPAR